jgi:hypothetical protein
MQDVLTFAENLSATVTTSYTLSGVTYNNTGSTLASCKCFLVKDNQDQTLTFVDYALSDANGNYEFDGVPDTDAQYLVIAWKDDSPHVFDVSDHVLQPT